MPGNTPEGTPEATAGMQDLYFDLQAEVDMTKHIGSLDITHKLLELVHIDGPKHVLDVGCGVGRTPAYLARKYGCTVMGIDIREKMIARSRERAKRACLEGLLEFHLADAQDLPFENARFDLVMTESVMVMIPDQEQALSEFVRVLKPGGYAGLNEPSWQKEPTPDM